MAPNGYLCLTMASYAPTPIPPSMVPSSSPRIPIAPYSSLLLYMALYVSNEVIIFFGIFNEEMESVQEGPEPSLYQIYFIRTVLSDDVLGKL